MPSLWNCSLCIPPTITSFKRLESVEENIWEKKITPEIHQSTAVFKTLIFLKVESQVILLDLDENGFHRTILLNTTECNSIYGHYDYPKVTVNKGSAVEKEHLSIYESIEMSNIYWALTIYQELFFVYLVNHHKDLINGVMLLSAFYRQRETDAWQLSNMVRVAQLAIHRSRDLNPSNLILNPYI